MVKNIFALGVFALAFAFAGTASAAVNLQNNIGVTVDGSLTNKVEAGDNFDLTFTVDVSSPDQIEWIRTRILDLDNNVLAHECHAITPPITSGNDKVVELVVDTPDDASEAGHTVEVVSGGVNGPAIGEECDLDNDNDTTEITGRLFITTDTEAENDDDVVSEDGNSNDDEDDDFGSDTQFSMLMDMFEKLLELQALQAATPPAPATTSPKPPVCAGLTTLVSTAMPGINSYANMALQNHLIGNGYSNVITYGATGFYGPQTTAAVQQANNACL